MNARRWGVLAALGLALGLGACDKAPTNAPDAAAAAKAQPTLDEVAAQAKGFTVGAVMSAQAVYVFFDPQCPHCGHLWQSSQPLLNRVKFVWIPIGMINRTSTAQGAALLTAVNPAQTMADHEASLLAGKGGLSVPSSVPSEQESAIKANTELFNRFAAESVPFVVLRDARTGAIQRHEGAMDTPELAQFLGLPATP